MVNTRENARGKEEDNVEQEFPPKVPHQVPNDPVIGNAIVE